MIQIPNNLPYMVPIPPAMLKDCPFCGSSNVHEIKSVTCDGLYTFSVCCLDCLTGIFSPNLQIGEMNAYIEPEEAVTAWNKRAKEETKA